MSKRNIDPYHYDQLRINNPDALNTEKIEGNRKEYIGNHFFACFPDVGCEYIEFDNQPIKKHLLIIPRRNDVFHTSELSREEWDEVAFMIQILDTNNKGEKTAIFWKNKNARSIQKLHIHYIIYK